MILLGLVWMLIVFGLSTRVGFGPSDFEVLIVACGLILAGAHQFITGGSP